MSSLQDTFASLIEHQFGRCESIGMTKLWICILATVALIHAFCRIYSTGHNFSRTRSAGRALYWLALPVAVFCLFGGALAFILKINFGVFFLSLAALEIGIWSAALTTIAISIELLSTNRPDMIRCGIGVAISIVAMAVSLLFGMPV